MSLIGLIIVLAVIGFVLWLVQTQIPMNPTIKTIITAVVVLVVVLYVLQAFGLLDGLTAIRVPRVR